MFRLEFGAIVLFVSLAAVVLKGTKEDPRQIIKRYQMECIEETRVDADVIANIRSGSWHIPHDQLQLVKNWTLCVLMKMGVMTEQGVYRIDVALARVPKTDKKMVEDMIDDCLSTKAIPAPDIAFYFVKCFQKTKSNYTVSIV